MRVLFCSTFGFGHVYPMVPLARAFRRVGHEVLWATSDDACGRVRQAGLDAVAAGLSGSSLQERLVALHSAAASVPGPDRASFMYPRLFGDGLTPPMTADLLPLARDWRPDLLVHEQGELAAPLVGAALGVRCVTHSFGGAVPPGLLDQAGHRLAPLWNAHGLEVPAFAGCFAAGYLDICPPELNAVPISHIDAVHPLRPVPYTGEEGSTLPPYLEQDDRPLVYLTLGTVSTHAPVLGAAVRALAALPVRVLVTVGPRGDPDLLGDQPPHIVVERFVPQTQVLPHCSVVVSHTGSGTFLGSLVHGLPQLCVPQAADQFRNAEAVVRTGAGLALGPDEATSEAIADGVGRLLTDPSFGLAARRQADVIRAMPSPDEVVALLERTR